MTIKRLSLIEKICDRVGVPFRRGQRDYFTKKQLTAIYNYILEQAIKLKEKEKEDNES